MNISQILALTIFIIMFALVISEKFERHRVTLLCGLCTIIFVFGISMRSTTAIFEAISLHSFFERGFWYQSEAQGSTGINWETLLFIIGMSIMVEGMASSGLLRWICLSLAKKVKYNAIKLLFVFMLLAFSLSMFIDSITVMMFLAAVTVELARTLKTNPIPFILSEIFCSNLGGAATMCGDPPNIIIGTALGYSFMDFVFNTGLMVAVSLVVIILYFYIVFNKELVNVDASKVKMISPNSAIVSKKKFIISIIIFLLAIVLLVTHSISGLTVASIGLIIAIITLILNADKSLDIIKKVDYKNILFFIGLFVVVSGIEQTGVLNLLSNVIVAICGKNKYVILTVIIFGSAILSAIIDNIPLATAMIPVIKSLSVIAGIPLDTLAWSLSIGTDIGGNATPIGASANVVGTSISGRAGYHVSWGKYCKIMIPATAIVLVISLIIVIVRY